MDTVLLTVEKQRKREKEQENRVAVLLNKTVGV